MEKTDRLSWPFLVGLVLLGLAANWLLFGPAIHFDFVNYDDDIILLKNAVIPSFDLRSIFTQEVANDYIPLTLLSYALEYKFVGLQPFSYHLLNVILHALNCGLLTLLFFRWSGRRAVATVVASLLFLLHPLHVESVAWVTERKDVLCTFFYLLSLLAYSFYDGKRKKPYFLCLGFFILALLSKSMAVSLPLVLLFADHLRGRPLRDCAWIEKVPFFALSAATLALHFALHDSKELLTTEAFHFWTPIHNASNSLVFYLAKSLLPTQLSAYYPMDTSDASAASIAFAAAIAFGIGVFAWRFRARRPEIAFGAGFFLFAVAPVLQAIPFGNHIAYADRYFYIPGIGLIFIYAVMADQLWESWLRRRIVTVAFGAAAFAVGALAFGWLTSERVPVWRNSGVLWADAIQKDPKDRIAYFNLGGYYLFDLHQPDEALAAYSQELTLEPNHAPLRFNIGMAYYRKHMVENAISEFEATTRLAPGVEQAHYNLAQLYAQRGRLDDAISEYRKVVLINPKNEAAVRALEELAPASKP